MLVYEHWSGADPGLRQSACRWQSHIPGGRLPLLSARPTVTFPACFICSVQFSNGCFWTFLWWFYWLL